MNLKKKKKNDEIAQLGVYTATSSPCSVAVVGWQATKTPMTPMKDIFLRRRISSPTGSLGTSASEQRGRGGRDTAD